MSRSSMVYAAKQQPINRFELVRSTARFARFFHLPNTRMADTINRALLMLGRDNRNHAMQRAKHVLACNSPRAKWLPQKG